MRSVPKKAKKAAAGPSSEAAAAEEEAEEEQPPANVEAAPESDADSETNEAVRFISQHRR